jgi:broad specificity phosphatase PhoE
MAQGPKFSIYNFQIILSRIANLKASISAPTLTQCVDVAEAFYGTKAWDCYWSLQDGNGTSTWADALLTPTGEAQAIKAHDFWSSLLTTQKIPAPQSYYASPLLRCLATASLTFSGLELPKDRPFIPLIKELFREANGGHTCDRRSSKSVIAAKYPDWKFEEGFAEEDVLWKADLRETNEALDYRSHAVLTDVLGTDENTWISISSHSGQIASALRGKRGLHN